MKKTMSRWQFWWRLILWLHALGIAGFYSVLLRRTVPHKGDRVRVLPVRDDDTRLLDRLERKVPTVSIIVPARDEAANIRRCVQSLLEQDYEHFEVIAVDDGSTDGTGAILDELAHEHPNGNHLWLLRLRDLPQGWVGKPHALHRGVQEAQGEWLLFTDADTWHAPNSLRSAVLQAVEEQADMFTMGAEQELPTFWDRALMPMAYMGISMLYPPNLVNDPTSNVAVANGQYILLRRSVYNIVGGYARFDLRGTLLDDRDLARVVKENGFRLRFVDGRGLVHVHMYSDFGEIWRGWRKNAYLGNRGGLLFVALQLVGLPMISIVPFMFPLLVWLGRLGTGKATQGQGMSKGEAIATMALEWLPLTVYRTWLNAQLKVPWYYLFTHPLAGAIFTGILGQSSWRVLTRKGVDWRGRQYHDKKPVSTKRVGEKV